MPIPPPERSVLHVLPHPGGGGERYVDLLSAMPGYHFDRVFLAAGPDPSFGIGPRLLDAARRARGHELLHIHGEAAAALCLPLLATRPSVVTLHGLHLVRRFAGVRREAALLSLRAVLRAADRTICVSQSEYDELLRLADASTRRRAVAIRNGVRIPPPPAIDERAAVRRELGIAHDEVVGIWVGSLDERKDPLTAVRAAEAAEVRLLVVGDGPLRAVVERAAGERTRVLGARDDALRLLAAADVHLLTSQREGLSLSLLEAMAAGLPTVVTDLPENVEAIGKAGVVVPGGDVDALAAAMRRLAASDETRRALGERARGRVAELFDVQGMVDRTRAVYEHVVTRDTF